MTYARLSLQSVLVAFGLMWSVVSFAAEEVIFVTHKEWNAESVARGLELQVLDTGLSLDRVVVSLPVGLSVDGARDLLVTQGSPIIAIETNQKIHADGRPQSFIDKLPTIADFLDQPARAIILGDSDSGDSDDYSVEGSTGTLVAVLDTGIDPTHPLFSASLQDGGFDFVDGDSEPFDEEDGLDNNSDGQIDEEYGHGSSVASLVLLADRSVRLLPFRIMDADGVGTLFDLLQAVELAVDSGAGVLQISASFEDYSDLLRSALDTARSSGTVIIASAGNTGRREVRYPAAYDSTLGVAATDEGDVLDQAATRGATVDMVAPGVNVIGAFPGGLFVWVGGSSMAAPFVAGAAARLLKHRLDPSAVEGALRAGATDVSEQNPGDEDSLGAGRLFIPTSLENI